LKGWLLDTNVVSGLSATRGSERVKAWAAAEPDQLMHISVLTLAEYDKGVENLPEGDPRRGVYALRRDAITAWFADRTLPVSDPVVGRWGVISGQVRRRAGHAPPVIDTLMAATAIEHGLWLVTRNVRDVEQSGAAVFDPWNQAPPKLLRS
jgi:hypothetical protein